MAITFAQSPVHAGGSGGQPMFSQIPNIYFNGFALGLSPSDVSLLVSLDSQPQVRLSMSFTTAKTLTSYLQELIEKLEVATENRIMKTDEVEAGLQKLEPEGPK